MAYALNKNPKLPKYVVVVCEADLIDYLGYANYGISGMYGTWLEFIAKEINDMLDTRFKSLPKKAKKSNEPFVYWVALPTHISFTDNQQRCKFNACLDTVVKMYANMRIMKLKECWAYDDNNLVLSTGRFTETGLSMFWKSVDGAVKFNVQKREEFLAKAACLNRKRRIATVGRFPGQVFNGKKPKNGDRYILPRPSHE